MLVLKGKAGRGKAERGRTRNKIRGSEKSSCCPAFSSAVVELSIAERGIISTVNIFMVAGIKWQARVLRVSSKGFLLLFPSCWHAEQASLLTILFMGSSKVTGICKMHLDVREQKELPYA